MGSGGTFPVAGGWEPHPGRGAMPGRRGPGLGDLGPPGTGPLSPPFGVRVGDPGGFPTSGDVPAVGRSGAGRPPWADEPAPGAAGHPGDPYGDVGDDDSYYDDDYDDFDEAGEDDLPTRRGCRNAVIVLAVLVLGVAAAGWFAWSWVQEKIDPPGSQGEEVLVEVPEGTSTGGVGEVLADAGVISDASVWNWYTKLRDVGTVQAGSYRMRLNSSFTEAIDALAARPLPPNSRLVTVPEGLTQQQIIARLTDPEEGVPGFTVQGMEAALADPASRTQVVPADQPLLEGVLYPETYTVEEGDTELIVVRRMVDEFEQVASQLDLEQRAAAINRTPYEVLIVASMVEREAGTPEDGPRVARVIYNRLAQDWALGIDATSCYEEGGIPCELTTEILEDDTPYDTRRQLGLPPTPIASPGRAAIEAALAPAEGDWMYYILDVTKDDGSSLFTSSEAEFNEAKERCVAAGRCG